MRNGIVVGLPQVLENMRDMGSSQIPFAVSIGLNLCARDVQQAEGKHTTEAFDRPKPFTRNAFGMTPSNKRNLVATVFAKDMQNRYLWEQAEGGHRDFKTFEEKFAESGGAKVALPGKAAKLDQYGNITKAQILRIAKDLNTSGGAKRFFKGVPKGGKLPEGIYTRVNDNHKIEPLLVFATDAVYEKRFKFSEIAEHTVTVKYEQNMMAGWDRAMKSAKK